MTTSPTRTPLRFESIDDVIRLLRESGQRLSSARRLVLEALFEAEGPVSADYISEGLGGRTTKADPTSVYRTLERLEQLGAVQHVHIGHGPGLYALVGHGERAYLACERCHRVTGVEASEMERVQAEIRERFGYEARFTHFAILGLCPSCSRKTKGRASQGHEHEHSHGNYIHSHPHGDGGKRKTRHKH